MKTYPLFRLSRRRQEEVRLQPGQAVRLRASGHSLDHNPGGFPPGLRGPGRQHRRQHHPARVFEEDRGAVGQSRAHLGDGSRDSDGGGFGGNAPERPAGLLPGGNTGKISCSENKVELVVEEGVNVEQILGQNPNGAMKVPSRGKGWRKNGGHPLLLHFLNAPWGDT